MYEPSEEVVRKQTTSSEGEVEDVATVGPCDEAGEEEGGEAGEEDGRGVVALSEEGEGVKK